MINDSFSDSLGTVLHNLTQKYSVPDFVKSANYREVCPDLPEERLSRLCADPANLRYPCHTKAATWLSAAYLTDEYENLPPHYRMYVGERLQKFAKYFGIENEVQDVIESKTRSIKQASAAPEYPDDMYISVSNEGGIVKRAGLLLNETSVAKAAQWVCEHRDELPLHVCCDMARKIVKRACVLSMKIPEQRTLERLLGFGFNDPESIADALSKRASLGYSKDPELSRTVLKIASEFRENPPEPGSETMFKAACFLDEYDSRTGLTSMRKRRECSYPEEIFYKHTVNDLEKVASQNVKLQNGSIYSISELESLDRTNFENTFGTDLSRECFSGMELDKEAAARVLPTLPRPMADRLSGLLKCAGVRPVRQEKATSAIVIPPEFFS